MTVQPKLKLLESGAIMQLPPSTAFYDFSVTAPIWHLVRNLFISLPSTLKKENLLQCALFKNTNAELFCRPLEQTVKYGYFETCFQASDSSLRSSFSLISESDPNQMIRVFSYSATEQSRHRVTMDAVAPIKSNNNNIKYVANPLQKHIFAMPETPVIVGIDWTPENITTYVDGHVIRQMENKHWHSSMHIAFSLTSVISSNGRHSNSRKWWRRDSSNHNEKRPDRFEVYYVRCWHRFPDHRKLLAPGVEVSPTHYQKTTSSSTHRSVHYKKATSKHARISRTLGFGNWCLMYYHSPFWREFSQK